MLTTEEHGQGGLVAEEEDKIPEKRKKEEKRKKAGATISYSTSMISWNEGLKHQCGFKFLVYHTVRRGHGVSYTHTHNRLPLTHTRTRSRAWDSGMTLELSS